MHGVGSFSTLEFTFSQITIPIAVLVFVLHCMLELHTWDTQCLENQPSLSLLSTCPKIWLFQKLLFGQQ